MKKINLGKFKKVLNILQSVLTVIVFTVLPLVVFTLISSKMELLGFRSFVVLTGSMSPLIPTGSIIYSQNTNSYRTGDIISFKKNDITVTHRIIDVLDSGNKHVSYLASPLGNTQPAEVFYQQAVSAAESYAYKTKGDANNIADSELVPAKNVVGEAMFHFTYIGFLVMFLKSMQGFLLAVVLPTFIFIIFELWKIKGEIERNIEKKFLEKMNRMSS